jgi:ABC-type sugar transport system ATPase subunit
MLNIIVGKNSSGKSRYLRDIYEKLSGSGSNSVLTNIIDDEWVLSDTKYDRKRVEILSYLMDDYVVSASNYCSLNITTDVGYDDIVLSMQFTKILTIICKSGDYLLLDEPDTGLSDYESDTLVSFLYRVYRTFKEVYLVTHDEKSLSMLNSRFFNVTESDGVYRVSGISREEAYECLNTI